VAADDIRFWHVPSVLTKFVLANHPRIDVVPYRGRHGPGLLALTTTIPMVATNVRAIGVWRGSRLQGVGLMRSGPAAIGASIEALTLLDFDPTEAPGSNAGWDHQDGAHAIVQRMVKSAVDTGRTHLIARVFEESPYVRVLTSEGFVATAIEYEYEGTTRPLEEPPIVDGIREQRPSDSWPALQLYRATTPAAVQRAEGRAIEDMDAVPSQRPRFQFTGPGWRVDRMVVSDGDGMVAWLGLRSNGNKRREFSLVLHPRGGHLAIPIVRRVLWDLQVHTGNPIVTTIREPASPVGEALHDAGFIGTNTHVLLMKDVAQPVAAHAGNVVLDAVVGFGR